jgi:hypothetical protein
MKLPCKYEKIVLESAMTQHLGIKKIDLDSSENVEKTILLILNFLELDNILQVQDTYGQSYNSELAYKMNLEETKEQYDKIRFTLTSLEQSTKEQFREAIIKFQDFLITE